MKARQAKKIRGVRAQLWALSYRYVLHQRFDLKPLNARERRKLEKLEAFYKGHPHWRHDIELQVRETMAALYN